jgi:hypothetical protein
MLDPKSSQFCAPFSNSLDYLALAGFLFDMDSNFSTVDTDSTLSVVDKFDDEGSSLESLFIKFEKLKRTY